MRTYFLKYTRVKISVCVRGCPSVNSSKPFSSLSSSSSSMSLLARSVLRTAAQQPVAAAPAQARNMATLREIELRLKSVRNIEKITKVCPTSSKIMGYTANACSVDENDCFYQTCKGSEGNASWQAIRYCQRGYVPNILTRSRLFQLCPRGFCQHSLRQTHTNKAFRRRIIRQRSLRWYPLLRHKGDPKSHLQ